MSPEEAYAQWTAGLGSRPNWQTEWARLMEALGRLVVHNSHGVHSRVVLTRLNDLDALITDLRTALLGLDSDESQSAERELEDHPTSNALWTHLTPEAVFLEGTESKQFREIDGHVLGQVIERYTRCPWLANDAIEWLMADAAVYHDVVNYGESIKSTVKGLKQAVRAPEPAPNSRRVSARTAGVLGELSAFVGGPALLAALAPQFVPGRIARWVLLAALACVGIYAVFAGLRILRARRNKALIKRSLRRWSAMAEAYGALAGPLVPLDRVRSNLATATAMGAIWSPHIGPLLDYVAERGVREWRV